MCVRACVRACACVCVCMGVEDREANRGGGGAEKGGAANQSSLKKVNRQGYENAQ